MSDLETKLTINKFLFESMYIVKTSFFCHFRAPLLGVIFMYKFLQCVEFATEKVSKFQFSNIKKF